MCHVCQRRALSRKEINAKKTAARAEDHKDSVYILFGIDISQDIEDIHPKRICNECALRIRNSTLTGQKT